MIRILLLLTGLIGACQHLHREGPQSLVVSPDGSRRYFEMEGNSFILFDVGSFDMEVRQLFPQATEKELADAGMNKPVIAFHMQSLYMDTGEQRIIIEPAGFNDSAQNLHRMLKDEGIPLESIDAVIITHAHFDHIGASITPEGKAAFANATYYIQKTEWLHWLEAKGEPAFLREGFRNSLLPLQEHVNFVDGEQTIVAGIKAVASPGHSPGHMSIQIGERLFYSGDSILQAIQVQHPEWIASWNLREEKVLASRKNFLNRIAENQGWLIGTHFTAPIGAVTRNDQGYLWTALEAKSN